MNDHFDVLIIIKVYQLLIKSSGSKKLYHRLSSVKILSINIKIASQINDINNETKYKSIRKYFHTTIKTLTCVYKMKSDWIFVADSYSVRICPGTSSSKTIHNPSAHLPNYTKTQK